MTVDVGRVQFETPNRRVTTYSASSNLKHNTETCQVTILDAPGHKDFVPNMIAGASSADAAVLVVDAGVGEFETGFTGGGQTREHALLLKSLGIKQLVVAVNKMDKCDWDKVRYDEIVTMMEAFLSSAGYTNTMFVPVSGLVGHNLCCGPPAQGNWYNGPQLVEALDRMAPPPRDDDKPLRVSVTSVHRSGGLESAAVEGRVEQGRLKRDDVLLCMPAGNARTSFLLLNLCTGLSCVGVTISQVKCLL